MDRQPVARQPIEKLQADRKPMERQPGDSQPMGRQQMGRYIMILQYALNVPQAPEVGIKHRPAQNRMRRIACESAHACADQSLH